MNEIIESSGDAKYRKPLDQLEPFPFPPGYEFKPVHLTGIAALSEFDIYHLVKEAVRYLGEGNFAHSLAGKTLVNLFYENSTRTQSGFELAAKRLGAEVLNMNVATSSVKKGETLIDTAVTLNAMRPDLLVIRHEAAGAPDLLAQKVNCSVINAGDGAHEHPTQALADATALYLRFGRISRLTVTICGDIRHSRVARSNIALLNAVGSRVKVFAPRTLIPEGLEDLGVEICTNEADAFDGVDAIMALRIQNERMRGGYVPSVREFYQRYGVTRARLARAKPSAVALHPGPVNRGTEIESDLTDDPERSLIREQVRCGVALRMAALVNLLQAKDRAQKK